MGSAGVEFAVHEFAHEPSSRNYGIEAAEALGVEHDRVFKTLLADVMGIGQVVAVVWPGIAFPAQDWTSVCPTCRAAVDHEN